MKGAASANIKTGCYNTAGFCNTSDLMASQKKNLCTQVVVQENCALNPEFFALPPFFVGLQALKDEQGADL